MSQPQIEFENVVKRFGNITAVERVNLTIESGEFLGIMGSSGCGKTTILRMLAGLETPTEGEIRLNGKRINELKPSERETPLVWQTLALFPFLSVLQNVEFGLKTRGVAAPERKRRAIHWLERMEIAELADRRIDQLSGGQRQRVALARALVTEPPVLLLDEPLSALDANLVIRMQGVLTRLQKDLGITFIYVTHSQSEAFAMTDRIVIMSKGRIEQIASAQEIFRHPANRFVAEFIGGNNILSGTITSVNHSCIQVATNLGEVLASKPKNRAVEIEESVDLVISADNISLNATSTNQVNEFPCKLISEEFVGSIIGLLVETKDGTEIQIQKQQHELLQLRPQSGKTMWLRWAPQNVYVLPSKQHP